MCCCCLSPGAGDLHHELRYILTQQPAYGFMVGNYRNSGKVYKWMIRIEMHRSNDQVIGPCLCGFYVNGALSTVHINAIHLITPGCKRFTYLFSAVDGVQYQ